MCDARRQGSLNPSLSSVRRLCKGLNNGRQDD